MMATLLIALLAIPLVLAGLSLVAGRAAIWLLTAIGGLAVLALAIVVALAGIGRQTTISALGGAQYLDAMGAVFLLTVALVYGLTAIY
ncbi:MAG: hypothetical protein ACYDAG_02430 [Chloroflexota bacterium]